MTTRALGLGLLLASAGIASANKPAPPPPPKDDEPPPMPELRPGDPRKLVAVLDVRIDGAPAEIGVQFQRDLDAQADPKRYVLAPRARIHEIMTSSTRWTEGCIVGPCLAELRKQTHAQLALLATLTGTGTSFGWVITLVRTDSGNVLAERDERCEVCTVDEALRNATRAAVDLLSAIPDQLPDEHPLPPPIAPLEREIASRHRRHIGTGIGLVAAGVAAAAAGFALYYTEGHSATTLGVAGGGIGLVLGGLVTFSF